MELTGTSWEGVLTITAGTLTNSATGTIQTIAGVDNRITGSIDNQGTISAADRLRIVNGGQTFTSTAGTIDVAAGVTFEIQNGTTVLGSGTGFTGTGTIDFTGTPTITLLTDVTLAAGAPTWAFGGTNAVTVNGPGVLINQASLTLQNDVVNAPLNNQATGTITVLPGTSNLNGAVTQAGTITQNGNNGDAVLVVANGFTNTGTMELTGTSWEGVLTITAGTLTNSATGTIQTVAGVDNRITGSINNQGTITVGAPLALNGTVTHADGAILQGTATLNLLGATIVAFDGDVNPGTSRGILNITGSFTQSTLSTINIEIQGTGTTPGVDFDQLNVSGTITLNGTINIIEAATPAIGDSLPVITFGTRAGIVSALTGLTQASGVVVDTVPTTSSFSLVARSEVLFAGFDGGTGGMFRSNPTGSGFKNITTEGPPNSDQSFPRWAPSRDRLTYSANNAPPPTLLHVTAWDGSVIAHPVTDTNTTRPRFSLNTGTGQLHLATICGNPSFSVQDVCVVADVSGPIAALEGIGNGTGKVFVTDFVDATLGGSGAFAWNPTNPDQMVVVRDSIIGVPNRQASQMWRVNFNGSGVAELTPNVIIVGGDTLRVTFMDWSPNGSFIAFSARNQFFSSAIYRVELTDGSVTQLTFPSPSSDDELPVIAPDGSQILFSRNGFNNEGASNYDLFVIPSGGGSETPLTDESGSTLFFGISDITYDWSPDGTKIVLTGTSGLNSGSYVIDPLTTNPGNYLTTGRVLVSRLVRDVQPSWRP